MKTMKAANRPKTHAETRPQYDYSKAKGLRCKNVKRYADGVESVPSGGFLAEGVKVPAGMGGGNGGGPHKAGGK